MNLKRFIAILLTFITVLSMLPVSAAADEMHEYLFVDQLDKNAAAVYHAIASMSYDDTTIEIPLPEPLKFNVGSDISDEEIDAIINEVSVITQLGIDAALMDIPEVYWLKFGNGGTSSSFSVSYDYINTVTINSIVLIPVINDTYSNTAKSIDELNQAIKDFNVEGKDRYTILKAIHDKLANSVVYLENEYAHEAYGALVKGTAVCEGYAEAFMLLCKKYEIPCISVLGTALNNSGGFEAHKWNYVQMEDGKWYAVDVTWDDTSNGIYYDYFLIGSETVDEHFLKTSFSASHISTGDFSGNGLSNFTYPELSKSAYVYDADKPIDKPNDDPNDDPNDNPNDNPNDKPNNNPNDKPNDTEIIKGDVNMDGKINSTDFMQVRKYYLGLYSFNENQLKAADTNSDGKINSTDFMQIRRHFLGTYNLYA